uniref:Phosphatidylinositol N-acetylglucosaminyltransferase subunit C n=1 Tax=Syphacia muris TaxID=451379 RepID=A0A0N5AXJ1_9BILA
MVADAGKKPTKWRKILYERQPYPDNYAGGSEFLKELRTNVAVVKYTWLEAVCGAGRVILHENAIVTYIITFENLKELPTSSCYNLLIAFCAVALLLYFVYIFLSNLSFRKSLYDHFFTLTTLVLFGYALTPVISTLTTTISTDTIYAMSMLLFLFSFVFHDYGITGAMVSAAFSVNLSLAASVCLLSRLQSSDATFCMLAFSMALFSYWPLLRNRLCQYNKNASLFMVALIFPFSFYYLGNISVPLSALHGLLHVFIMVIAPWVLMIMQPMKSTIHGPWDEVCLGVIT